MSVSNSFMFLKQFLCSPRSIGAVSPSSRRLAQTMVEWFDWSNVGSVAEYGPGTGIFTEQILAHKRPDAKFFAVEANPEFATILRDRYPGVSIHNESVSKLAQLCQQEGIEQLDAIVCGLPWASFAENDQIEFLQVTTDVLRAGGQFATFAYLQGLLLPAGQSFKRKLGSYFREIEYSRTVWLNLPPAFVYRCRT